MSDKYSNLRARLAALKLSGPVSTSAAKWEAVSDALDVELVAELLAERDAMVQPPAVSDAAVDLVGNELARKHAVYLSRETVQDLLARAILALRPQAVPMTDAWNWLTEANIDAYLEDYEMRGEDEAGRDASYTPTEGDRALLKDFVFGLLTEAQEAAHGITAQAKGGA